MSEFSCTVRYCPWLEELSIEYGPQLSSSDVADMTAGRGLACLHSLSLSFTPISPKALHQLTSEYLLSGVKRLLAHALQLPAPGSHH